jgi:Ca2+-binding EF-hand superfamily protein
MDRNKDGYITKGELKLAKKSAGMGDIDQVPDAKH